MSRTIKGIRTAQGDIPIHCEATAQQAPKKYTVTLYSSNWNTSSLTQSVSIAEVLADESAQLIQPMPSSVSMSVYYTSGVKCISQSAGSLTFQASSIPNVDLIVYVVIQDVENA